MIALGTTFRKLFRASLFCLIAAMLASFSLEAQDHFALTKYPDGSRVTSLAVTDGGRIMASLWGKGIYVSDDGGQTWTLSLTGLTNLYVTKIHPAGSGKIFASTMGGGVFTSTNNGDNWTAVNSGLTNLDVRTVSMHQSGALFAGTYGSGVYVSYDNGKNWAQTVKGLRYRDISCMIPARNGFMLAGTTGGGIYMSRDTGKTWRESNSGVTNRFITDFTINTVGDVFAATNGRGVLESPTNGIAWAELDSADFRDMNITAIALNSDQELIAGTVGDGIYYYDKYVYKKWRLSTVGYLGITAMTVDKNNVIYAVQAGMTIIKSTDKGRTWKELKTITTDGQGIVISKDNGLIITAKDDLGIRRSTDYGASWSSLNSLSSTFFCGMIDQNNTIFLGYDSGLLISADQGINFSPNQDVKGAVNGIAGNNTGTVIATSTVNYPPPQPPAQPTPPDYYLWKSTDYGQSFNKIDFPYNQERLLAAYSPNGTLYLTTGAPAIFRSTNNGETWDSLKNISGPFQSIDFDNQNRIYCSTNKGIYKSEDNGDHWTFSSLEFQGSDVPNVRKVAVNKENTVFALVKHMSTFYSNMGVWRSFDNAASWDSVNSSIMQSFNSDLDVNTEGDVLLLSAGLHRAVNPSTLTSPAPIAPAVGAADQLIQPVYQWHISDKAELYQIEVSANSGFSAIVDNATLKDTAYAGEFTMDNNTVYYWRVRSKVHSAVSPWSAVMTFRTKLPAPALSKPAADSTGVEVAPELTWQPVTDAAYYRVQVSLDKNFTKIVFDKDSVQAAAQRSAKLAAVTEYWWRAMCYSDKSVSDWSQPWKFKTTLAPPDLVAPANAAMDVDVKPYFKWKKVNTVTKYYILIADNENFANAISDSVIGGDTVYTRTTLDYNKMYYWKVKSQGPSGTSDWSEVWNFTTVIQAPALLLPANDAKAVAFNPLLDWSPVTYGTLYRVQVAKDLNFKDLVVNMTGDTTSALIGPLDNYTTYYWRVQAQIGERIGLWSEIRSFKTNLSKVELRSPGNSTISQPTVLKLEWFSKSGSTYYFLQAAKDESFNDLIISKDSIAALNYTYDNFEKDTRYFWRVKAWNADGSSEWSDIWNFTTGTNAPVLRQPENNSPDVIVSPLFRWDQMTGMQKYQIQVAKDDAFGSPVIDKSDLAAAEYQSETLEISTKYYWRVRGFDGVKFGEWSPVWNFTTKNTISVKELETCLAEAYPNPFTNEFSLSFKADVPCFYRITVSDVLGNYIATLSSGYASAGINTGKYKVDLPAGAYFIKLEAGESSSVIRLIKAE